MNTFYKRHFLRLLQFNAQEIQYLIDLAFKLKKAKKKNQEIQYLTRKNLALIFEKDSTRTRCAFEVAAYDQGANVTYLGPIGNQINYKESIKDTARVLGKMYDGIQYRGFKQIQLKILSNYAEIPVWNGLTNDFHPTQILSDLLTMQEYLPEKKIKNITLSYIGDASNNISNSMLEAAALFGMNFRLISPKFCWPKKRLFNICSILAKKNGGNIKLTENIAEGVIGSDFIYTDVWISMGENKSFWEKKINFLRHYQVNKNVLALTYNPNVKFLHCLPAFHNKETELGAKLMKKYCLTEGMEVTNNVFESKNSIVFEQAANRIHVVKAIMLSTLLKNSF
ncbi:ornithine carbamoyltransferase [Candidatus Tachikawaea gelatinosa]|uniref:Ornithine carbamoyltransferase n=1 Tax=Candidatus Tachikawaea gelatinosa TaxID=1410383 RepID=A0A090AJ17_9ENTR|nr:ornithine carbamoyltransferase [Candidatus Tachikawaea gelatinosa]BAP58428.1 ornithine carbamoyltransferase catabolic [Candidatus Tachikawaea gelatinosa]